SVPDRFSWPGSRERLVSRSKQRRERVCSLPRWCPNGHGVSRLFVLFSSDHVKRVPWQHRPLAEYKVKAARDVTANSRKESLSCSREGVEGPSADEASWARPKMNCITAPRDAGR